MQKGLLTVLTLKNLNFQNPRLAPYRGQTVKISNFSKTKMAAAAIVKNHKNRDITAAD